MSSQVHGAGEFRFSSGAAASALVDDVTAAIADPVRRDILVMLRDQRLDAGQIADR
jgi:hypothetical protein